jgi:hypothetical protein
MSQAITGGGMMSAKAFRPQLPGSLLSHSFRLPIAGIS